MLDSPERKAGKVINQLLAGQPPNGITPESCGKYGEVVAALYETHNSTGTKGVCTAYQALLNVSPELEKIVYPFKEFGGFSAFELGKMNIPAPSYLVDGVVPQGCSLLAAAPKIGKTLFALNIAYGIACGGVVLGNVPVSKASVLFLALEGSKRGLKRRLKNLAQGEAYPENLHFYQRWPDKDNGGYDLLKYWIDQHNDAGLIVVDTLKRVRGTGGGSRYMYNFDYEALQPLSALAEMTNVSIIAIHHTRKMESADPLDMVSGTHGLTGAVDNVLVMQRSRRQADAILTVIPREEDEAELALKFDEQIKNWVLIGHANELAKTHARQEIIDVLKKVGEPMTPKKIAETLGKKPNNIKQLCHQMKKDLELTQPQDGHYDLHPVNNP